MLCVRFLVAAGRTDWMFIVLGGVGFSVATLRPAASLFSLILAFTLIGGLQQTSLLGSGSVLLVLASSIWLGCQLRKWFSPPATPPESTDRVVVLVNLLASISLALLFVLVWRHRFVPDFWADSFWSQPVHGPGDPAYGLTSGFLWLHGLFYFRALRQHLVTAWLTPDTIKGVVLLNSVLLLFFLSLQWLFELPARWVPGFQSPYEDIATFGIMAASFLVFWCARFHAGPWPETILRSLGIALLALAAVASWSRAAWLAGLLSLGLLALLRLPRRTGLLALAGVFGAIVLLNLNAARITSADRPFVSRLLSLVRFEDPMAKTGDRAALHRQALAMIRARPWTGHGAGSFYRQAPHYAPEGFHAGFPQFPHNLVLQLAAEQGLPSAGLFIGLMMTTLWRGGRQWIAYIRLKATRAANPPTGNLQSLAFLVLGLTLMLSAYLQANLTWDILMVHPTQPFFFWFLIAALWTATERAEKCLVPRGFRSPRAKPVSSG